MPRHGLLQQAEAAVDHPQVAQGVRDITLATFGFGQLQQLLRQRACLVVVAAIDLGGNRGDAGTTSAAVVAASDVLPAAGPP
jgi:hypothetical protein